jgi:hypothetical protein
LCKEGGLIIRLARCEGAGKSAKFDLAAAPFTVELTGVKADSIKIAISRD